MKRALVLLLAALTGCATAPRAPSHFEVTQTDFVYDGQPTSLLCGEMHFARIPHEYWRDRLRKARGMGLNAVATYVFWNVHEPSPGQWNFSGDADVATFVRTAREEGLMVLLRPGPYACAEWDFGGYPWWLMKDQTMKVRTTDPKFLAASDRYMKRLGQELAPLQVTRGGPIVLVQVENEYGSFGHDHMFMNAMRDQVRAAGFDVPLFTADGPSQTPNGHVDGALPCINGGDEKSTPKAFASVGAQGPLMVSEFYPGWLDHWGEKFVRVSTRTAADDMSRLLDANISVNLYVLHGGTNFGFMNGANYGKNYQPSITSYDYDAPLDEAGHATPKYFALRDVIARHLTPGNSIPAVPADLPTMSIPAIRLDHSESLLAHLPRATVAPSPLSFEDLDQGFGYVLYTTALPPNTPGELKIPHLHDFATVMVDGKVIGSLDRRQGESATITLPPGQRLWLLVENAGRINYGNKFGTDRKGLFGDITLAGQPLHTWNHYQFPMSTEPAVTHFTTPEGPALHRGTFTLTETNDTYLDLHGWTKGIAWVNGHNLGRYWNLGPQQTLYIPGVWLRKGTNQVTVFEQLAPSPALTISGVDKPILDELRTK